jgi:hypothetical protein
VILVWRTSQTATRGPHSIEQSTIFIWCVIVYWFSVLVNARIIFVVITFVFSHKKARIIKICNAILFQVNRHAIGDGMQNIRAFLWLNTKVITTKIMRALTRTLNQ